MSCARCGRTASSTRPPMRPRPSCRCGRCRTGTIRRSAGRCRRATISPTRSAAS
ncbi:hypothetical protein MGSAQ_001893 [marine sediment metagenome]|uniref:Uncharacterized protein n=1 Tax=marine sediment metagenome TaxID=412755 RepID=A0A1B6NTH5_9ZZZZ